MFIGADSSLAVGEMAKEFKNLLDDVGTSSESLTGLTKKARSRKCNQAFLLERFYSERCSEQTF